jgi:hypothetical protein
VTANQKQVSREILNTMKWKVARKKIEKTVIEPFRPENLMQALKIRMKF